MQILNKRDRGFALLIFVLAMGSLGLLCDPAVAQTPFSLVNIGQKIDPDDGRMAGRGYWGMAVNDSLHPGFKNTASLTSLQHVALELTGYAETVRSKGDDHKRTSHRTFTPDLRVGLPLLKGRLAVTAGFRLERSMQYRASNEMIYPVHGDTTENSTDTFERWGSIFSAPVGVGLKVTEGLSVAGTYGLVNGSISETLSMEPDGVSYLPTVRYQEEEFSGHMMTWAALWTGLKGLQLGASYTPGYDLNADRIVVMKNVSGRHKDSYTVKMPDAWAAGFQLNVSERWRVGGDYQFQEFSKFVGRQDWNGQQEDEYSVGFGIERRQASERRGGWNNLPIRFGAKYRQWGYQVGGNPIVEKTITAGTGFPFREDLGQLDVALSYSRIGEMAKNDYESSIWRLTVSVTGLERWW